MRFLIVAFMAVALVSCQGINKILKSKDAAYKLRMAEQYYAKGKYVYAQQLYEDVIPFYKGRPEFEDIYYKYAYTAYKQADYLNAENLFKTYLEAFPNRNRFCQLISFVYRLVFDIKKQREYSHQRSIAILIFKKPTCQVRFNSGC